MDEFKQSPGNDNPFATSSESVTQPYLPAEREPDQEIHPRKLKYMGWSLIFAGSGASLALIIGIIIYLMSNSASELGNLLFFLGGIACLALSGVGAFFVTVRFDGNSPTMKSSLLGLLASVGAVIVVGGLAALAFILLFFVACLFSIGNM